MTKLSKKDIDWFKRWLEQCEVIEVYYAGRTSGYIMDFHVEEFDFFVVSDEWRFYLSSFSDIQFDAGRGEVTLVDAAGEKVEITGYSLELVQWVKE